MDPKLIYFERAADTIIKNLQKRRMEGFYCKTRQEALKKALSFLSPGDCASSGGSMTLNQIGLMDALRADPDIKFIDRETGKNPEEMLDLQRHAFFSDYFFMSTNAITMDGELINIDGSGNRVSALIYGPKNVIIIAGMNKVTPDVHSAVKRVRGTASSPNCIRLNKKTPCSVTGICGNCLGDDSICSQTVITRRSGIVGRIKVILVGEELGY
ncbi:Uncharacterised ACR%2C YkgG family COG1556 [uncultured Roseburia sp.]|uniref:Lactate utilization protein n=1 Tax=Brotonthovivens ammoniilytica TaxID=2981725 RepID=A0ABT2TGT1_9FIRM|nr:lactate utilization protein [Brotonthovivens ammoniilytica]MCU6760936.1 lactate utilization protein [Brotonthovivens ammoniilytica]SCI13928.1 Uncharacterised ACR%2C YkgG family COG1556 [uncultured Roseburia sp.]